MFWFSASPLVCLAPMDSYTDSPFRQIVKKIAPHAVLFTEFISVDGLTYNPEKVSKKYIYHDIENPLIVQLFGSTPEHFVNAIKMLEKSTIAGIDINMGCPARHVIKCEAGAALLKNQTQAYRIAEACVKAAKIPISIKTRLGWKQKEDILVFGKKLEECGISALTVHARTYDQGFSGETDWEPIYELKKNTKTIKIIGNGDIRNGEDALNKIKNLDGIMVGRKTIGNPWLLQEIIESLRNKKHTSPQISFHEKIPVILEHCKHAVSSKGEKRGICEMRKHFSEYVKGIPGAKEIRSLLMQAITLKEIENILYSFSHN